MSLRLVMVKILMFIRVLISKKFRRVKFYFIPSYQKFRHKRLLSYFNPPSIDSIEANKDMILDIASLYSNHCFDLLGSGWVNVRHDMDITGFEGLKYKCNSPSHKDKQKFIKEVVNWSNYFRSKKIYNLVSEEYVPIDWHIDFKSGYRWMQKKWYTDIKFGNFQGVDVKVPWELSRMQHLPFFVYAYLLESTQANKDKYILEFQNQILDFIGQNPPNYGVNWKCTMDVGIRVSNWLLTYDLFIGSGVIFSDSFKEVFINSVYDHGKHIINNLEWGQVRNNHYLANVAGLLFVAAYLAPSIETDMWLAFALQELSAEVEFQFNDDGSNFEGSTCYHRLSLEMVVYSSILSVAVKEQKESSLRNYNYKLHKGVPVLLPFEKQNYDLNNTLLFPHSFWQKIYRAGQFSDAVIKSDGLAAQIGDNDSGRFFKLWPSFEKVSLHFLRNKYLNLVAYPGIENRHFYWNEISLDHSHIVRLIDFLFNGKKVNLDPEISIIQHTVLTESKFKLFSQYKSEEFIEGKDLEFWKSEILKSYGKPLIYMFNLPELDDLNTFSFSNFGLFIIKNDRFFLSFKCGSMGTMGRGAHDHNDQLSLILTVGENSFLIDPGTYVYTADIEKRNFFRSTRQHFTIQYDNCEQNVFKPDLEGLFFMKNSTHSKCLYFSKDGFVGYHDGFGGRVYRIGQIKENQLVIMDYGKGIHLDDQSTNFISDGYGRVSLVDKRD